MGEGAKQEQAPAADQANDKPEEKPVKEKKQEQPLPAAAEEKKQEEKTPAEEEKKEEEPPQPPSPFVLHVDLHCVGCAKKIERSIKKIRGVEGVAIDMDENQLTIKGVVEPQSICDMITKKTKRSAKVLSPLPANGVEPMPEVATSQVSGLTTVELNVNMHCEACAAQLKKKILKMRGVQTAETELSSGKVTVTGTMDANKLVEYVYRRTKKQARIVPQPKPENPPEEPNPVEAKPEDNPAKEGGEEKPPEEEAPKEGGGETGGGGAESKEAGGAALNVDEETMKRMMYYYYNYQQPLYVVERIPPPQLFSDENPNACSIS